MLGGVAIFLLDAADIIERPLHLLGLHGAAWVVAAGWLGLVLLAATTVAFRRLRR